MKYLVDANVLSEATRPRPAAQVIKWMRRHEADLVVTPIVLGEIEYGIRLMPAGRKRTQLLKWFAEGVQRLRVLDLDAGTATTWAMLLSRLKQQGRAMPVKDSLIAASAIQHRLAIATRNRHDFENAGVQLVDPFA
jgi:predicted nucleic acid-binding protein